MEENMIFFDKIKSNLKNILIAIIGFFTLIIFGKLISLFKERSSKKDEEVKATIDESKDLIKKNEELTDDFSKILNEMTDTIVDAQNSKDELVSKSNDKRTEIAEKAGFKKKE
jgi:uncharacterized membrane-anchored protein YhcB (DUF1043 family)